MKDCCSEDKKNMEKKILLTERKRKIVFAIFVLLLIIFLVLVTIAILYYTSNLVPEKNFESDKSRLSIKTSCSDNPCVNGFCKCSKDDFICVCKAKYTGRFCESRKPEPCSASGGRCLRNKNEPPQVENGWYPAKNGYQYLFSKLPRTWEDSRRFCRAYGADLAAIGSRKTIIRTTISAELLLGENAWIGLSSNSTLKGWAYVDGVKARRLNAFWSFEKVSQDDNCAVIEGYNIRSKKRSCLSKYGALCEKEIA